MEWRAEKRHMKAEQNCQDETPLGLDQHLFNKELLDLEEEDS